MLSEAIGKNKAGSYKTRALFAELCRDIDIPIYTLAKDDRELDGKMLISLHKAYIATNDPTEYTIATTLFCGWRHWEETISSPTMKAAVKEMRDELRVKLKSLGLEKVIGEAKSGKNKYQAAKYLADGGWIATRTKAAKAQKVTDRTYVADEFSKDLERISKH